MKVKSIRKVCMCIWLCLIAIPGGAWGTLGHETIIEIAKRHLTVPTRDSLEKIMPYDITRDARWMDRHRSDPQLLYMYHFHEQCINVKTLEYDPNAQVEKGDIMRALFLADYNLRHRETLSDSVIVLNVRMLIHFIGDLHCPVHVGIPGIWFPKPPYRQDLGKWYFKGKAYKSFHWFLDYAPEMIFGDVQAADVAALIDNRSGVYRKKCCKGDFIAWTNDAARRGYRIYGYFPPLWEIPDSAEPKYIPDNFLDNVQDILVEEIQKAGYQLSSLLNAYFDPHSR